MSTLLYWSFQRRAGESSVWSSTQRRLGRKKAAALALGSGAGLRDQAGLRGEGRSRRAGVDSLVPSFQASETLFLCGRSEGAVLVSSSSTLRSSLSSRVCE